MGHSNSPPPISMVCGETQAQINTSYLILSSALCWKGKSDIFRNRFLLTCVDRCLCNYLKPCKASSCLVCSKSAPTLYWCTDAVQWPAPVPGGCIFSCLWSKDSKVIKLKKFLTTFDLHVFGHWLEASLVVSSIICLTLNYLQLSYG